MPIHTNRCRHEPDEFVVTIFGCDVYMHEDSVTRLHEFCVRVGCDGSQYISSIGTLFDAVSRARRHQMQTTEHGRLPIIYGCTHS